MINITVFGFKGVDNASRKISDMVAHNVSSMRDLVSQAKKFPSLYDSVLCSLPRIIRLYIFFDAI